MLTSRHLAITKPLLCLIYDVTKDASSEAARALSSILSFVTRSSALSSKARARHYFSRCMRVDAFHVAGCKLPSHVNPVAWWCRPRSLKLKTNRLKNENASLESKVNWFLFVSIYETRVNYSIWYYDQSIQRYYHSTKYLSLPVCHCWCHIYLVKSVSFEKD